MLRMSLKILSDVVEGSKLLLSVLTTFIFGTQYFFFQKASNVANVNYDVSVPEFLMCSKLLCECQPCRIIKKMI